MVPSQASIPPTWTPSPSAAGAHRACLMALSRALARVHHGQGSCRPGLALGPEPAKGPEGRMPLRHRQSPPTPPLIGLPIALQRGFSVPGKAAPQGDHLPAGEPPGRNQPAGQDKHLPQPILGHAVHSELHRSLRLPWTGRPGRNDRPARGCLASCSTLGLSPSRQPATNEQTYPRSRLARWHRLMQAALPEHGTLRPQPDVHLQPTCDRLPIAAAASVEYGKAVKGTGMASDALTCDSSSWGIGRRMLSNHHASAGHIRPPLIGGMLTWSRPSRSH